MPGPIPQRTDQTVRRNKPDIPLAKIEAIGPVAVPDLDFSDPHPLVADLYRSLSESAQSKYYEASDWEYARFALYFADVLLKSSRPSAQLLASVNQMLSSLLVSEGDRRRVRLEIERNPALGGQVLDVADMFRQRLAQS